MFNTSAFIIYILVTAFTPGPNNITSMANAARFGFKKSYIYNIGMLIGFSIVMILCAVFSATLQQLIPTIKAYLTGAGAAYMLFLAWTLFTAKPENFDAVKVNNSKKNLFWQGFTLQFLNPKIIIYGITSLSVYVVPCYKNPVILTMFALLLAVTGSLSNIVWALTGSFMRLLFIKHYKIVNTIFALLLVCCTVLLFI